MPASEYEKLMGRIEGLGAAVDSLVKQPDPVLRACAVEFILEGLHLHELLNKDEVSGRSTYHS